MKKTYEQGYINGFAQSKKKIEELEQALDEIEKYIEEHKHLNWYVESCYKNDLLEIIQKAKGDVKNKSK